MIQKFLAVVQILDDFFIDSNTKKIVREDDAFITNDPLKVISSIQVKDQDVAWMVKVFKDVFKSRLCHRRYLARLVKNLMIFLPESDFESIRLELLKNLEEIKKILDQNMRNLRENDEKEMKKLVFEGFDEKWLKIQECDLQTSAICRVKGCDLIRLSEKVDLTKGVYFRMKSQESANLFHFFSRFRSKFSKSGKAKYWFSGYFCVVKRIEGQDIPEGSLVLSGEPFELRDCFNIHSVPPKVMKNVKGMTGFYQNLKVLVWNGVTERDCYKDRILYGFDSFDHEDVVNVVICLETFTVVLQAPTDPALESLEVSFNRLLNRDYRFLKFKSLLPSDIDFILSERLENHFLKLVFQHVPKSRAMQDYSSKYFMISKSFDIVLEILQRINDRKMTYKS